LSRVPRRANWRIGERLENATLPGHNSSATEPTEYDVSENRRYESNEAAR
jgi:hypothetical protein